MKAPASLLALFAVLGLDLGCDGGSGPAEKTKTAKAPPAASKGADAAEPDQGAGAEAKEDGKAGPEAAPDPDAEEWLVWFDTGEGVRTRWYTVDAKGTPAVTAERKALVVANDAELWLIKRQDARVAVQDCMCLDEDEGSPMCTTNGHVAVPGLVAEPMTGDTPVSLVASSEESIFGEVFERSLGLNGGVGTQLFAAVGDSGFYCGAHPMYESGYPVLDPTASKPGPLPEIELPRMLRKNAAAAEMFDEYRDCEGETDTTLDGFVDEVLTVSDVSVALKGGRVSLTWNLVAPVMYACSADYLTHGQAHSGLLPAGKALGLSGPPEPTLAAALKHVDDAKVVGWSKLKRAGEGRAATLKWFKQLDETPWPAATQVEVEAEADAEKTPVDSEQAKRDLARGRKLTRAGKYDKAVEALDAAIAADATLARAWAARGYARLLDHKFDEAQADCEQALKLGGTDRFKAAVFFNLGQVEVARHDAGAARVAYSASLALRENKEVRAALESL